MRILAALMTLVVTASLAAAPVAESIARATELERSGQALDARALLGEAAEQNPRDIQALLAYAQFLDRHDDPKAFEAYQAVLNSGAGGDQARLAARRAALLALEAGDPDAARGALDAYRNAEGKGMASTPSAIDPRDPVAGAGFGYAEIPGIFDSFLRMAALSTDLEPADMLPALARNIVTSGYRTLRGGEGMQETEYLKLVRQYLSQARELMLLAGPDGVLDVPACESTETAELLKILGYRLRGECGPDAVIETVNPSRAFLSIDSAFPLAELEDAFRRDASFQQPYSVTRLPVLFGPDYWTGVADGSQEGDFIDIFLSDPALARLYVAMSKLHRPTAITLKDEIPAEHLKNYANVLDFFGGSFELRDGRAVVPGPDAVWENLVGVSPTKGVAFLRKIIETDDGWLAAYFDALARTSGEKRAFFTGGDHPTRFYGALRGSVTSPGPARPIFRATSELLLLTSRLVVRNGQAHLPGGVEPWKKLFTEHPHGKYDGKLTKSANGWTTSDDVVEALFGLSRKVIENEPLRMFNAISSLDVDRDQPLSMQTVERLILDFPAYGDQYVLFNEAPNIDEAAIIAHLDAAAAVDKIGRQTRRADATGSLQAIAALWQILVRQGQVPAAQAGAALTAVSKPFAGDIDNDEEIFQAARSGLLALLAAAGVPADASPQQAIIELLAGRPGDGSVEAAAHQEMVTRLNTLFNRQRLVSIKDLVDLADHLERVSRGESFNVAMANRLAGAISEVPLPRAELSTQEENALGRGGWVDNHIRDQRSMNLQRSVDKASGDPRQLLDIRGEIAPVLRDSLVGLVYIYYSPPGAELIRANPLYVRNHDFLGPEQSRVWQTARVQGSGWPSSGGGRVSGSLAGIAYALNDAEQNFLIPTERQALIWQDLAPQVLLGATVPRWWDVDPAMLHYVGLHLRHGRALFLAGALDAELRERVFGILSRRVEPARRWAAENALLTGRVEDGLSEVAPAELYEVSRRMLADHRDAALEFGAPFAGELVRLEEDDAARFNHDRVARLFGVPHPSLAQSYRPELLELPLFPTMMGYSSRALAESWESTNLYWAALADETHVAPAQLNLLVPEWTQKSIERIFATHLEDWPALLRSMRMVGERYRAGLRARLESRLQAAAQQ